MAINREFKESPMSQGEEEQIAYQLTSTPWGSTPTSIVVKIYDAGGTDKSTTCLSGTASATGDIITLPVCKSLTAGNRYKLQVKFTSGGNVYEAFGYVDAEE